MRLLFLRARDGEENAPASSSLQGRTVSQGLVYSDGYLDLFVNVSGIKLDDLDGNGFGRFIRAHSQQTVVADPCFGGGGIC